MSLSRRYRAVRRRSRDRSPNPGAGLGVSEWWTAPAGDRKVIARATSKDPRLAMWLLGLDGVPQARQGDQKQ